MKEEGEEAGRYFNRFSCVMGECDHCPKWNSIVPKIERESDIAIRYSVRQSLKVVLKMVPTLSILIQ